jgi:saccharopine dehydrogenase-like NADP-dependent oxidoreductase
MQLVHVPEGPIVLVGGTGVVGRELVKLLASRGGPLVITGRDAGRAAPALDLCREGGVEARFEKLDLAGDPQAVLEARAVVTLVNDPADAVLGAALTAGVPYVDIARWTSRFALSVARTAAVEARSPLVFSSAWMGGIVPRVAAALRALFGPLESVESAVRYAIADASGADSVGYLDRMSMPFEVVVEGRQTQVMPLSDGRVVDIGGHATHVSRIDTPEQWTMPATLGVRTASLRIGFDDALASFGLRALQRLGIFCLLSGERFTSVRHGLLRSSGSEHRAGAQTSFRVDVQTREGIHEHATFVDPKGQAHLTAVGALLSLELALREGTRAGVHFPEQDPANVDLLGRLTGFGVLAA